MTSEIKDTKPARLDRADIRVRHDEGLGGAIRAFLDQFAPASPRDRVPG